MDIFDTIIVGAGSAGCVLAYRLSADPSHRVLLIESGPEDRHPLIEVPKASPYLIRNPRYAWHFPAVSELRPDTPDVWVRGRVLGGSSAINGLVYARGQPEDYDEWEARGDHEWGWRDMARCFREIEDHELGPDELRGSGGPLHIAVERNRHPMAEKLIQAGVEMGLPRRDDLNRIDPTGIGYFCKTAKGGRRVSAAKAFLRPVRSRPNLRIETDTTVNRILIREGTAVGVSCVRDRALVEFHASGGIILSAGAIQSPKLLALSGIGPGGQLQSAGIEIKVHSPSVGQNLREHLAVTFAYRLKGASSHNSDLRAPGLWKTVLRYLVKRDGVLDFGPYEVGAFLKTDPALERADVQFHMSPFSFERDPAGQPLPSYTVERDPGLTVLAYILRPQSRGSIEVISPDPAVPAVLRANWLSQDYDRSTNVAMMRLIRRLVDQPALRPFIHFETVPGVLAQSDAELLDALRRLSFCGLHAVGTCAMGAESESVVDSRLRVRGVGGLRIVDCSVMPTPISGNTNGPAMALAWRAAELIIEDRKR